MCTAPNGIAWRRSPAIGDRTNHVVRFGQIIEAAGVEGGWLRAAVAGLPGFHYAPPVKVSRNTWST